MRLVESTISLEELKQMSEKMAYNLVKAVVDIEKKIMMVDADLHADEEVALLDQDSDQKNLWGINIYPERVGNDNWIEFDSMINLRPSWGNKTRGVDDPKIREQILAIVKKLVTI